MTSTESAREFVRSLTALTEKLAHHDIVVRRLNCDWSSFGSWIVEVASGAGEDKRGEAILAGAYDEPGPDVFRVTWDGRDRRLSMDSTATEAVTMLNKWRALDDENCDSHEAALVLAEEWLRERLQL